MATVDPLPFSEKNSISAAHGVKFFPYAEKPMPPHFPQCFGVKEENSGTVVLHEQADPLVAALHPENHLLCPGVLDYVQQQLPGPSGT